MSITEQDVKKKMEEDEDFAEEIIFFSEELKRKSAFQRMLKRNRLNWETQFDVQIFDRLKQQENKIEFFNSCFTNWGCSHKVSFYFGPVQVTYRSSLGPHEESNTVFIDNQNIIDLNCNETLFEDISFCVEEETKDIFSETKKKKFIDICAQYFPEDKPEHIFYFILGILAYHHDT